jgi:hypothetical protein
LSAEWRHCTSVEICAVALSAEISSEAVPKFILVADALHRLTTVAETENVPLAVVVVPAPPTKAAQVDCELVSQ